MYSENRGGWLRGSTWVRVDTAGQHSLTCNTSLAAQGTEARHQQFVGVWLLPGGRAGEGGGVVSSPAVVPRNEYRNEVLLGQRLRLARQTAVQL